VNIKLTNENAAGKFFQVKIALRSMS